MGLMKSKKGFVGPLGIIFIDIVFVIVWALFLANFLAMAGTMYITTNAPVGFEAWFYNNLNFVVLLIFICFNAVGFYGGSQ